MYTNRQLMGVKFWLMMLAPPMLALLIAFTSHAQCNYNEGASPTFNVSGNNTGTGYSTVIFAADDGGNILYLSTTANRQLVNLAAGKYNIYSFNYRGAIPSALTIGGNISALITEGSCADLSSPIRIGVCKCTDEIPASGNLGLSLTSIGQNSSANYTQQYLLVSHDGKIEAVSNTGAFEISEVNSYSIYGINYKTEGGLSTLSVGGDLGSLVGDCFALSDPIDINVCPTGSLPVTLVAFDAKKEARTSLLAWTTSEETNSDRFEIQRSINGKTWKAIDSIKAFGESQAIRVYAFTDNDPFPATNFYRLKMIDLDQSFAYSRIREVNFKGLEGISNIYPNPANDVLNLKVTDLKQVKSIKITSLSGQEVYLSAPIKSNEISLNKLTTGTYILRILYHNGSEDMHRFVHIR